MGEGGSGMWQGHKWRGESFLRLGGGGRKKKLVDVFLSGEKKRSKRAHNGAWGLVQNKNYLRASREFASRGGVNCTPRNSLSQIESCAREGRGVRGGGVGDGGVLVGVCVCVKKKKSVLSYIEKKRTGKRAPRNARYSSSLCIAVTRQSRGVWDKKIVREVCVCGGGGWRSTQGLYRGEARGSRLAVAREEENTFSVELIVFFFPR